MKKYVLIAVVIGAVALVVKKLTAGKDDWTNLTEAEARQRLHDRFPDRMPEEKKDVVTEKIVSKMRDKGVIIDLTEAETADDTGADDTIVEETASTN
jgi:hypothetical protein